MKNCIQMSWFRLIIGYATECTECVVGMISLKVLNEASLAYEAGLQQRNITASSSSAACAGAVAAAYNDAWEKFSLDGDRSVDPPQPGVDSIKESSQL